MVMPLLKSGTTGKKNHKIVQLENQPYAIDGADCVNRQSMVVSNVSEHI